MPESHEIGCPCPDCVAARHAKVVAVHPLIIKKAHEATTRPISRELALEMEQDAVADLRARLAIAEDNVRALGGDV